MAFPSFELQVGESQRPAYRAFESVDVGAHDRCSAIGVAVSDRFQDGSVFEDRILEVTDPVQRQEPDAQCMHVVLIECGRKERVVRRTIDEVMDSLVHLHQLPLLRIVEIGELGDEGVELDSMGVSQSLSCQFRGERFEDAAHLRQRCEVSGVDRRHEDPAPRVDLDQPLLGQATQGLADRGAAELQPSHQILLAHHRTGREVERDDQAADRVVGLLCVRAGIGGIGL